MSDYSPPATVQVNTIAGIKSKIKQKDSISRHGVKHINGTGMLWARLEKLIRELKIPRLVAPWAGNTITSIAKDILIYLIKICLSGSHSTKEPMVLENIGIKHQTIRDPEETMEGGAGPDWFYMTVCEDFPNKHSHATYIEGKVKQKKEATFDGLLEAVKERIAEWEATDKKKDKQKSEEVEFNPTAAAILQDPGHLELHLQSLFRGFVPPVPWSEDETVETSKTLATYLNKASQLIMNRIRRPVVLEKIKFLYRKSSHGNEGETEEHYDLRLFQVLPEQGPGKTETLKVGPLCPSKDEALAGFMKNVRDSLEEWKKDDPKESITSASSDKKGKGAAK